MRITSKHPVRAAIGNLPTYHEDKSALLGAVSGVLKAHDILMDAVSLDGDDGFVTIPLYPVATGHVICDCCAKRIDNAEFENGVAISWYTMPSGRVELTCYIS